MPLSPLPSSSCRFEGCTLTGALTVTTSVRDSVSIVHGPAGCTHHNFSLLHTTGLDRYSTSLPSILSSGMTDMEVVFGGEDALRKAIRAAVSRDTGAVFVLSTCIAEAIGDDVAAVCSGEWEIPVIPLPTAGFLGGSFQKGVNNALNALAGIAPPRSGGDRNGRVNIVGEKNLEFEVEENYAEVVRLLRLLDLEINIRFVHDIGIRDLEKLGSASLNILRDAGVGPVGQELFSRFHTPSIAAFPEGFSSTLAFLSEAGEACGVDPREAVAREREAQQGVLCEFSDIAGAGIVPAAPSGAGTNPPAIREIMELLGMKIAPEGTSVPLPFVPPVGTAGVKRLLHRWRRALHA